MIYIVSGFMRSGTSMMMQALIAGGMQASFSTQRNQFANNLADDYYHPNKTGLYEIPLIEYKEEGFPLKYKNQLIKIMIWGMDNLAVHDYSVIVMQRHPEEIRQSYEAFLSKDSRGIKGFLDRYTERMNIAIDKINNRKDVKSLTVFEYRDIVNSPLLYFKELAKAWPINPELAASVIDEKQYRFRLEKLTVGI